jgi:Cu+-exporting ATPase
VHELLFENGLRQFYDLSRHPGVKRRDKVQEDRWLFLDAPEVRQRFLDFEDGKSARVTFHIPSIHCVACVWLLENLYRLAEGVGQSQVDFERRNVSIAFAPGKIRLSQVATLLESLGYEPSVSMGTLEKPKRDFARKKQWLQVGIAGFAFGNIMLFSLPVYMGLDSLNGPFFKALFGWLTLVLAIPVVTYSAGDYWRSAWISVRQRLLTLDVPIALGLAALYFQSAYEILSRTGEGYLDSLCGLVFFLLCGRVFQQKTHDRIVFDRDYRFFFPLAVTRRTQSGDERVAISSLRTGDRLLLRHGEVLPADGKLLSEEARIDYSFVSGEAEAVPRKQGDYLYAGGRQAGGAMEMEITKPVSQSYLVSLWDHETFRKKRQDDLNTLTNRYSRQFTAIVIGIAFAAGVFWILAGAPGRGVKAFASVLIVACPCALALAAPFALGTGQRLLAKSRIFLRNGLVLERTAQVDAVVFDKTGTLTESRHSPVRFIGEVLTENEAEWTRALASQSSHPFSLRVREFLGQHANPTRVADFAEQPGAGIRGTVGNHDLRLGSREWLESAHVQVPQIDLPAGSAAFLSLDGKFKGVFVLSGTVRAEAGIMLAEMEKNCEVSLLSGDNEREKETFQALFGPRAVLRFQQSPFEKLAYVETLQNRGRRVMMVGDGLNDAGALRQSDVGVAVVDQIGSFSPASDVILPGSEVSRLARLREFSRSVTRVIRWSFGISGLYNLVGVSVAAAGLLSPILCAILMPLSSATVVLFACGMTRRSGRRCGF